jgi:hypothetical protein
MNPILPTRRNRNLPFSTLNKPRRPSRPSLPTPPADPGLVAVRILLVMACVAPWIAVALFYLFRK